MRLDKNEIKRKGNEKIKNLSGWEAAVRDAEMQIDYAKCRIRQLQISIRIFKKKIDGGEGWPGAAS